MPKGWSMPVTFDQPFMTNVGNHYVLHSHHRNGNPEKSQWCITPPQEIELFEQVFHVQTPSSGVLWGLRVEAETPHVVGVSCMKAPPVRNLRIAKFISNMTPQFWHGYPADYRIEIQDRPPIAILNVWRKDGYIQKHEVAKI